MAVNRFFNNGNGPGRGSEQDLIEGLIIEYIQLSGMNFYYIPRTLVKEDKIFNEDPLAKFENFFEIEMYLQNATNFDSSGSLLGKFGLELHNTIELNVSRSRFKDETFMPVPLEGDLIYWPLTKQLWQIDFVESENQSMMYQAQKLYIWTLKCTLFTYSHEDFDTGIPKLDNDANVTHENFVDKFDKEPEIEAEAETDLDFSESNPFGDLIP